MNETCIKFKVSSTNSDLATIKKKIYEIANVLQVPNILDDSENSSQQLVLKFSAQTLSNKSLVLVTLKVSPSCEAELAINCEKMVIGSMLAKEIKQRLEEWL